MSSTPATVRDQMVSQQIRAWDVLDERVLGLLRTVPREAFVPEGYEGVAYADSEIPLGHGQRMLAPKVVGRILQALEPSALEGALEIGTGSGYLTACLAASTREVISVEIHEELARRARANLARTGYANAHVEFADALARPLAARFNLIAVTGSLPRYDERFQQALEVGGRLFIVVGAGAAQEARLVRRTGEASWASEALFETWIEPLVHADRPSRFVF